MSFANEIPIPFRNLHDEIFPAGRNTLAGQARSWLYVGGQVEHVLLGIGAFGAALKPLLHIDMAG